MDIWTSIPHNKMSLPAASCSSSGALERPTRRSLKRTSRHQRGASRAATIKGRTGEAALVNSEAAAGKQGGRDARQEPRGHRQGPGPRLGVPTGPRTRTLGSNSESEERSDGARAGAESQARAWAREPEHELVRIVYLLWSLVWRHHATQTTPLRLRPTPTVGRHV